MQTYSYDMMIVGGGIVGLTLACALAQQTTLSIVVLEAQSQLQSWSSDHQHHRVSAISLSSQRVFQALDIWDAIAEKRISPFTKIMVWDANNKNELCFNSSDIHEHILGYIIENNAIHDSLKEKLKSHIRVEMIDSIALDSYHEDNDSIKIYSKDDRLFEAKLAIAADGANSWLRQQANIDVNRFNYQQKAIVSTIYTEKPHLNVARQVFLPTGPLAFLPLSNANACSIVWSLPLEDEKRLSALDATQFKNELSQAFSYRLGAVVDMDKRYTFPLYKQQAKHYIQSKVVLVGDAAHTVHPLAGQGLNMGLLDATSLCEVIEHAMEKSTEFNRFETLRRYERWRKADNMSLALGIDIIKKLYASATPPIPSFLSIGLSLTNRMQLIKKMFTNHAVGNRRGLPKLAK